MSNGTIPKNLTFLRNIVDKATALMKLRDFGDNLSGFLSQLVREEYERRHGPVMFPAPPKPKPQPPAEKRVESSPHAHSRNQPKTGTARKPRKFSKG